MILILIIVLIAHTVLSLQKNKLLGLTIPFITIIFLLAAVAIPNLVDINYIITYNGTDEKYDNIQLYEKKVTELIANSETFKSIVPENSNLFSHVVICMITLELLIEFIILGVCHFLKGGSHMNNKKHFKRFTSYILVAMLFSFPIFNISYAADKESISTAEQLETAIELANADNLITTSEKEEILNVTTEEALLAYALSETVTNEIQKVLTKQYIQATNTISVQNQNDDVITSNTYHVNNAVDVTTEITDEQEQSSKARVSVVGETGGAAKDLGDRKTTGAYKVKVLGVPIITLKLTLGYTVNTTNLTARYSSPSFSVTVGSISTSTQITDSVAAQIGHDMNCIGSYDINIAGVVGMNVGLELKVKWHHNIDADTQYITYTLLSI